MDKKYYHVPVDVRPVCPVCKKSVYSRGGIHPQCAMIQSEPPRIKHPIPPLAVADGATPAEVGSAIVPEVVAATPHRRFGVAVVKNRP